jgi:small subunit ribosomal protein S6
VNAYEIMLILDPELAEERQNEIVARMRELIETRGGSWVGQEPWGRRKLAYEIDKKGEGTYHLLHFDADAETLAEVTRVLKITDGAMRHMAVRRSAPSRGAPKPSNRAARIRTNVRLG